MKYYKIQYDYMHGTKHSEIFTFQKRVKFFDMFYVKTDYKVKTKRCALNMMNRLAYLNPHNKYWLIEVEE